MARRPLTFRQRDVVAVVKAVERAGHQVGRVEVDKDGKIVVVIVTDGKSQGNGNEWDAVLP
jgi:hypothetical protein